MALTNYHSQEKEILLSVFENTKLDNWIALTVESFIYEYVQELHNDGSVKSIHTTRFGQKHGECYDFWPNGNMYRQCTYIDGRKHGIEREWRSDGTIYCVAQYENGCKHGHYLDWWRNGNLRYECDYVDGQLHGESREYFEDGTLQSYSNWAFDELDGELVSYYEDGQIENQGTYNNGRRQGEYKSYWDNGKLFIHCFYDDEGELTGEYLEYTYDGELNLSRSIVNY